MHEIRVGIVGCGLIGRQYAERLPQLGARVVAVADPFIERRSPVAEISGAASYHDANELLAEREIDLLCVCSPTPFHHEAVLAAARHGTTDLLRETAGGEPGAGTGNLPRGKRSGCNDGDGLQAAL